jgi:hypothetical protein
MIVQIPCYVLLEYHCDERFWCLDWRGVCDGAIDCFDEGLDEKFCFEMEINECGENEYRCHNGLCIPQEFWEEDKGDADCLDRSDEVPDALYILRPVFKIQYFVVKNILADQIKKHFHVQMSNVSTNLINHEQLRFEVLCTMRFLLPFSNYSSLF